MTFGFPRLTLICNSNIVTRIPVPSGFGQPAESSEILPAAQQKRCSGTLNYYSKLK